MSAALSISAEPLRVFSEFTRLGPDGQVLPQDRGGEPRHILSPGVARNAHASFRIVLSFDKREDFILDVGQNPENAVDVKLYDERGGGFQEVPIPFKGQGERTFSFWLDVRVRRNAPVERIKVEPQLHINSEQDWYTYPMEVRILEATAPDVKIAGIPLPGPDAPSDQAAFGALREALCGQPGKPSLATALPSAQALIHRNAVEHIAIARQASAKTGRNVLLESFLKASGEPAITNWCAAPFTPKQGPEWYLKMRDAIFRTWPER